MLVYRFLFSFVIVELTFAAVCKSYKMKDTAKFIQKEVASLSVVSTLSEARRCGLLLAFPREVMSTHSNCASSGIQTLITVAFHESTAAGLDPNSVAVIPLILYKP